MERVCLYDESGDLHQGFFYELEIPFGAPPLHGDLDAYPSSESAPFVVRWPPQEYPFVELEVETIKTFGCSLNEHHVTHVEFVPVGCVVFGNSSSALGFIPSTDADGITLVSKELSTRLKSSRFTGAKLVSIRTEAATRLDKAIDIDYLSIWSAPCVRERRVVNPNHNSCPHCGYSPIVCRECHDIHFQCPKCRTILFNESRGSATETNDVFEMDPVPSAGMIIDVDRWDGSDFISGGTLNGFVTRRVVDWLIAEGVLPFVAWPARADLSRATEMKRRALELTTRL